MADTCTVTPRRQFPALMQLVTLRVDILGHSVLGYNARDPISQGERLCQLRTSTTVQDKSKTSVLF